MADEAAHGGLRAQSYPELQYLSRREFKALTALADVIVHGDDELVPPEEIAANVDRYLASFRARSKWLLRAALLLLEFSPLLTLKPPLSAMRSDDRLTFVKRRFYLEHSPRIALPIWQDILRAVIRMGKQLAYLGYYSDRRTFASVGYTPFSERPKDAAAVAAAVSRPRPALQVETPAQVVDQVLVGDVVVIGSGAGGSILAYNLAKAGRQVLMVERGQNVDPSEFSEDEVEMFTRLYSDGALQLSRDFRFQVLQGSCVGGTTVVNNAVCFDPPAEVLDRWNDPAGLDAGLDLAGFGQALAETRKFVGVQRQDHPNLNRGADRFVNGARKLGYDVAPGELGIVEANIHECLGCGYCNIGCAYGKKLSMLDTVLPRTQQQFGPEALRIVAGCEVESLRSNGGRISGAICRLDDGTKRGRRIEVRGNAFVVAAGAVSSSLLLQRSGLGGKLAGRGLSFNMGSSISAVYDDVINSYEGLQISHYLRLPPDAGAIIETWFNPPVAQALSMPGWFEDHFKNMRRFNRMSAVGALVGTESNAVVRAAGLTGREIDYVPTEGDRRKLGRALVACGEAFLADGATCVMPSTFKYVEYKHPAELAGLPELVMDVDQVTLGTGHPQGGNAISRRPDRGVVDEQFRVFGYQNLFVCDASVFPTSLGVNPQLTVMALAQYASPFVAQAR